LTGQEPGVRKTAWNREVFRLPSLLVRCGSLDVLCSERDGVCTPRSWTHHATGLVCQFAVTDHRPHSLWWVPCFRGPSRVLVFAAGGPRKHATPTWTLSLMIA